MGYFKAFAKNFFYALVFVEPVTRPEGHFQMRFRRSLCRAAKWLQDRKPDFQVLWVCLLDIKKGVNLCGVHALGPSFLKTWFQD
jgi:hypothetical protein